MEEHLILSKQCPKINLLYLHNEGLNLEILFDSLNQKNPKLASLVCGFVRNIAPNIQIQEINNIITFYAEFIVQKYELNIMKQPLYDDQEFDALYTEKIGDKKWDIAWQKYSTKNKTIQNIQTVDHLKEFLSKLNIKLNKHSYDKFMKICTQNDKYNYVSPNILKRIIKVALDASNHRQTTVNESIERLIKYRQDILIYVMTIKSIFDIETAKTLINKNDNYNTQYFDTQEMNITNCNFNVESLFMNKESENNFRHRHPFVGSNRLKFSIRARALFVCSNVCSEYCEWIPIQTVNKHGMSHLIASYCMTKYDKRRQFFDYWKQNVSKKNVDMCEWMLFWKQFNKLNEYELKRCYYYLSNGTNKNILCESIEKFVNRHPGGNMDNHDKKMKSKEWEGMRQKMRSCFPIDEKYKNNNFEE